MPSAVPVDALPAVNGITTKGQTLPVGVWSLNNTDHADAEPPSNTEALISVRRGDARESIIGKDDRVLVDKVNFKQGGKYRGIVKLFLRYFGQAPEDSWAMATGWLIRPDLVVTAGHCSYDWEHGLGRLTNVKAYIGYCGNESIYDTDNFDVQFRTAISVATTSDWLGGGKNEARDVSFIKVSTPFDNVQSSLISYAPTPLSGDSVIGVVGYPGDLMEAATSERGAFMYEMYLDTPFDLTTSPSNMLAYQIDTFGGNSGSPVFQKSNLQAIGVHVLGGFPNSASVIGGQYGNSFPVYTTAIDTFTSPASNSNLTMRVDTDRPWLDWFDVPGSQSTGGSGTTPSGTGESLLPVSGQDGNGTGAGTGTGTGTETGNLEALTESFKDFLTKALSVGSKIAGGLLSTALPLALGPMAGPVAALAGVAINVAGKTAASSTGTEADIGKSYSFDGAPERAILGESALAVVSHMAGKNHPLLPQILARMQAIVAKNGTAVTNVAPKLFSTLNEPSLRIALDTISKYQISGTESLLPVNGIRTIGASDLNTKGFASSVDDNTEAFIAGLSKTLTQQDAESFMDILSSVGSIISKGLRVAAPIISSVAQTGLPLLMGGVESDVLPPSPAFDGFGERAVVGEAALESIMQVDPGTLQTEGFFDIMKSVITKIGPIVIKQAPAVIHAVTPLVQGLLQPKPTGSGESFNPSPNPPASGTASSGDESAFLDLMRSGTEAFFTSTHILTTWNKTFPIPVKDFLNPTAGQFKDIGVAGDGFITASTLQQWQSIPTNLSDPNICFVDCRDTSDLSTIQILAANVVHCLQTMKMTPTPTTGGAWYKEATKDNVKQVVFYCVKGESRSPSLGRWYKGQIGTLKQEVILLAGGITAFTDATIGGRTGPWVV